MPKTICLFYSVHIDKNDKKDRIKIKNSCGTIKEKNWHNVKENKDR